MYSDQNDSHKQDSSQNINELQWFDFEIRMRRVIQEFMEPTIERITRDRELQNLTQKRSDQQQKRVELLESVVLKTGSSSTLGNNSQQKTVFEEISQTISDNDRMRKIGHEQIKNEMQNVVKMCNDQNFIIENQQKQIQQIVQKIQQRKMEQDKTEDSLNQIRKELGHKVEEVKLIVEQKEISMQKDIRLISIDQADLRTEITGHSQQNAQFEKQLQKSLYQVDMLANQIELQKTDKLSKCEFETALNEVKDQLYSINKVMDEFSNEFLRVENYIEKYIPLRMQNTISETLDNVLQVKDKKKLREYEEKKFFELRNNIIEDKGLPNLIDEIKGIINQASKYDNNFTQFMVPGQVSDEAQGLQEERLQRHKHMHIITENMMKLNPSQFQDENKNKRGLEHLLNSSQQNFNNPNDPNNIDNNNNHLKSIDIQSNHGNHQGSFYIQRKQQQQQQQQYNGDDSKSSFYHNSIHHNNDPQESTFERLMKNPAGSSSNQMNGFQVQMRNAIFKMVRNKEQDDLMRQQFRDEMDTNNRNLQELVEKLQSQLTARLDVWEKKQGYIMDESKKMYKDSLSEAVDKMQKESGQMLEYAQNSQTQIDQQKRRMDKLEDQLKQLLANFELFSRKAGSQLNILNFALVTSNELKSIDESLKSAKLNNSLLAKYKDYTDQQQQNVLQGQQIQLKKFVSEYQNDLKQQKQMIPSSQFKQNFHYQKSKQLQRKQSSVDRSVHNGLNTSDWAKDSSMLLDQSQLSFTKQLSHINNQTKSVIMKAKYDFMNTKRASSQISFSERPSPQASARYQKRQITNILGQNSKGNQSNKFNPQ
eukprot:403369162